MWTQIISALLTAILAGWFIVFFYQKRLIKALRIAREELQVEEDRVFDFLHGLGEAFTEEIRVPELHRLIVESAMRILEAHGGALYLVDRNGKTLVPAFISKGCPPLVTIPPHILEQAETTPVALESYLRLHPVEAGDGILGTVWTNKEPAFLSNPRKDERLLALRESTTKTESAMVTPLLYGKQNLGVLAVANGPMGAEFTEQDFVVFKSIAEQSAFALYNAIVYGEASEKKRLDHDLQIAREIQRILLPSTPPAIDGFEVSGMNIPARQVSGDYFDYIRVDDERWGVVIADVSGKGIPASLIMAMCRSVLRSQAWGNPSAADVLRRVNRQLYPDIKEDMFISMAYLIVNRVDKTVTLSRAGHDAPLLYSKRNNNVVRLNPPGMALGIDSGDVFDRIIGDFSVSLEADDCLVLYTDGITEALDSEGAEYGMDKMIESVRESADQGAGGIIRRLTDDVRNFAGNSPQHDDITLIAIRKL